MARVETAGPERIQGYSVILGDDNACYDKFLVLFPEDTQGQREADRKVWTMNILPAYRQELEENLPDQKMWRWGVLCETEDRAAASGELWNRRSCGSSDQ